MTTVSSNDAPTHRAYCYCCKRAQTTCLCAGVEPFSNQIPVHVVQHPKERRHAFGTVRLLEITLQNLQVHRLFRSNEGGLALRGVCPTDAAILYPGEDCPTMDSLAPDERPTSLVVIDGTWSQAHKIYRDCSWLHGLRRIRLNPSAPGRYRIRKEPRAECLSTLEAVVSALDVLEPTNHGIEVVIETFERMVERQLEYVAMGHRPRVRAPRKDARVSRALPAWLADAGEEIVVVYGEISPRSRHDTRERELAQWSATRLRDPSDIFDAVIQPRADLTEGLLLHQLGWSETEARTAQSLADVLRRWRSYVRPNDRIVAWYPSTLDYGRRQGLLETGDLLKSLYANLHPGQVGSLFEAGGRHGFADAPVPGVAGRADRRLGQAWAMVEHLASLARTLHPDPRAAAREQPVQPHGFPTGGMA